MTVTISLSGELSDRVQSGAKRLRLSPQIIVENILRLFFWRNHTDDALEKEINRVSSFDDSNSLEIDYNHSDNYREQTLEEVVAEIKALPRNPAMIKRGEKVGDMDYIQYLIDNPPTDTMTMEEWAEEWPPIAKEIKELRS
ncbi:MAG: hypothetical protein AAF639_04490 [Chloroflexota bacterium]